jgi:hypothetical protein
MDIVGPFGVVFHTAQVGPLDRLDYRAKRLARRGRGQIDQLHHLDLTAGIPIAAPV